MSDVLDASVLLLCRAEFFVFDIYIYTKSYIFMHNLFARLRRLMLLAIEGGREFRDWREEGNIVTKTSFT